MPKTKTIHTTGFLARKMQQRAIKNGTYKSSFQIAMERIKHEEENELIKRSGNIFTWGNSSEVIIKDTGENVIICDEIGGYNRKNIRIAKKDFKRDCQLIKISLENFKFLCKKARSVIMQSENKNIQKTFFDIAKEKQLTTA
jgi:hypothetical protein